MKVGELYFSLGLKPDASWGRVRNMVSGLRNQMRGLGGMGIGGRGGGAGGRGGGRRRGGLEGFGPDLPDAHFLGPGSAQRADGSNRSINWATSTGDPFGGGRKGGAGGGPGTPPNPVNPSFFKKLRQGINDLNLFRRALYGTFAVQTIQTVADLADSYTNLHNRLQVLTGSQEEAEKQYQKGREVADATRSDVESTVEGFVRIKNATKEMGLSYDQTWAFVETLQQSLVMSGASTQEAASGMRQLTQALAKGKLDGDEFKSIAENMPNILTTLSEATGKTEGQLRAMSAAGEITRKVIVDAFTKMKDKIANDFGKTVPTVGQQFVKFKNQMIDAFGRFGKAVDLAKIAGAVFKVLGVIIVSIVKVFEGLFFVIGKIVGAFQYLWKEAMSGSDVALAVLIGIGAALAAIIIPNLIALGAIIYSTVIPALVRMGVAAWTSAGPYALMIAGAAAIAYGIIKIVRHWDAVKAAAQTAWEAIESGFSAAFEYISDLPIIKQLIWLANKLDSLTGLGDAIGGTVGGSLGIAQQYLKANAPAPTDQWGAPMVNDPNAASAGAGKNVTVGATTVNIYATDAADAKRKFDKDALDRQNRHAAAALSR